jgi:hypothetical protein
MKAPKALSSIALTLALALGNIPGPAALKAASAAGVQLIVAPTVMSFKMGPPPSTAVCEVTIRVIAPGHTPWRLTLQALGPLQSPKGSQIPASRMTWKGSPAHVFFDGTLSDKHPQLLGRGQGSKVGVVQFLLQNSWDLAPGQFNQKLLYNLSSP